MCWNHLFIISQIQIIYQHRYSVLCAKAVFTGVSIWTLGAGLALKVHSLIPPVTGCGIIADNQLIEPTILIIICEPTSDLLCFCPDHLGVVQSSIGALERVDVIGVVARVLHL